MPMLCRVCVNERNDFENIFDLYYDHIPVTTFIKDILHIKMDADNDSRMLFMCNPCNTVLYNFYGFYKMVGEAQQRFNQMNIDASRSLAIKREYIDNDNESNNEGEDTIEEIKSEDLPDKHLFLDEDNFPLSIMIKRDNEAELRCDEQDFEPPISDDEQMYAEDGQFIIGEEPVNKKSQARKKEMTNLRIRIQKANEMLLSRYTMEEICRDGDWLLTDEQIQEFLPYYAEQKCTACSEVKVFSEFKDLKEHSLQEHGENPLARCCKFRTTDFEKMKIHILYKHLLKTKPPSRMKLTTCPVCAKPVRSNTFRDHLSSHLPHDKREFQCEICRAGFGTRGVLNAHMKKSHSEKTVQCEECGKMFTTKARLTNHMNYVHPAKQVECDQCHKMFKNKPLLRVHTKSVHGLPPLDVRPEANVCQQRSYKVYSCPHCHRKFRTSEGFSNHVNSHRGTQIRVKCNICNAVLKKSSYPLHARTHDPKNKKQCPYCPYKAFVLYEHILNVHKKIRQHVCDICSASFFTKIALRDHIDSRHIGILGYSCDFCGKKFKTLSMRNQHHRRIHPQQYAEMRQNEREKRLAIFNEMNEKNEMEEAVKPREHIVEVITVTRNPHGNPVDKRAKNVIDSVDADSVIKDIEDYKKKTIQYLRKKPPKTTQNIDNV